MSFSLVFIIGIIIQKFISIPSYILFGISIILVITIWLKGSSNFFLPLFWLLTFVGAMFRLSIPQERDNQIISIIHRFDNHRVQFIGEVKYLTKTERGYKYRVKNYRVFTDSLLFDGDVYLHFYTDETQPINVGTEINTTGNFKVLRGPRNPGEFDFKTFYKRRNIWGSVFHDKQTPILITDAKRFSSTKLIEDVRQSIKKMFDDYVGGDAGNLMSALIVGLREEVPKEIKQDFADTGVIHILAVSGLHVAYVLLILTALVKLFRIPYRWDKIAIILSLFVFVIITGGKASVWRASLMASLYVIAPLFNRKGNLWNIVAASALILLIVNPTNLFDLGFQLSFSAVISIVFFSSLFNKILPTRLQFSNIQNSILKYVLALFIVSLSAQIGTLPFTWTFFNRIPIISLIANVIIIPAIGVLVAIGFAILFLGSWIPYMGWILGNSAWVFSQGVFSLTHFFADLPFAYLDLKTPSVSNIIQYVGIIATTFLIFHRELWKKGILVGLLTLNLILWPWALQKPVLDVIFLDVGQGDATLVRVPSNSWIKSKTILIDAGMKNFRRDMGERVVLPVLKHLGIHEIDLLVISHPHSDHIGGMEIVLEKVGVDKVWDTFSYYHSRLYQRIMNHVSNDSIPYKRVQAGEWYSDFEPAETYVFHPDSLFTITENNINNNSIVIKLLYGDISFLFVGDLEKEGDREVVRYGEILESNVLKVGHHGSVTSTTQHFLNLVKPKYAIVSVGENNKFQHPSQEVIRRLKKSGAVVLRTDHEGAIWMKSNGREVWRYD